MIHYSEETEGPAQERGKEEIQKEVVGRFQDAADPESN